jgi:hypothetical protein
VCKVVDGSPCCGILCVVGIVAQGYVVTGWGFSLSSLTFCVGQVFEVAREVYACVVESGFWCSLVLDSDKAKTVVVYLFPLEVVLVRRMSGFGKIDAAFVCLVFLV